MKKSEVDHIQRGKAKDFRIETFKIAVEDGMHRASGKGKRELLGNQKPTEEEQKLPPMKSK